MTKYIAISVLLDDVLAAVDAHVAKHLFRMSRYAILLCQNLICFLRPRHWTQRTVVI
jgi:hypothetical protein